MRKRNQLLDALGKLNAKPLVDNVYLVIGKKHGIFPYSNSLLIIDEEVVLIDSGIGNELLEEIKDHVDILINSHYHIDHILGNHLFSDLWVVEEEAGVTSSFLRYKKYAGIQKTPVEEDWMRWFHQYFRFHPSSPTKTFKPNDVLNFGETKWIAVHTPGHTAGHCCFYEPNKKLMFATDIDLTLFGPWYGNPPADLPDFIESIKKLSDFKMDMICTSHAMPLTDNIGDALEKYLNIIFERDELIITLLNHEMTLEELEAFDIIYKKEQKRYKIFAWFERNMLKKHLDRLMELDKVERTGDRYRAI